jgi:hypothetical protein
MLFFKEYDQNLKLILLLITILSIYLFDINIELDGIFNLYSE